MFETFTNSQFVEIETLGPITRVLPGQIAEQVEYWALFRDVKLAALTDEDLDRVLVPLARAIGGDQ